MIMKSVTRLGTCFGRLASSRHVRIAKPVVCFQRRALSDTAPNGLVKVDIDEKTGVATLLLNRGPVNFVNLDLAKDLQSALYKVENDERVKGLVIGSAFDKVFCAGFEIAEVYKPKKERLLDFWKTFQDVMFNLYSSKHVTMAAVQGHSIAGGCGLAIACDYRVMADYDRAKFGFNETHLGIIPPLWLDDMIVNILGQRQAELSLIQGSLYSPAEALKVGFVDIVVPEDQCISTAQKTAAKWAKIPSLAREGTKLDLKRNTIENMLRKKDESLETFVNHLMKDSCQKIFEAYIKSLKK